MDTRDRLAALGDGQHAAKAVTHPQAAAFRQDLELLATSIADELMTT